MSSDALISAAFNGDLSTVQSLVDKASATALQAALMNAANKSHANVVKFLFSKGVDVNTQMSSGFTPLTIACSRKYWDIAKLLIESGADVNMATSGYTALIYAAREGEMEIVDALIVKGADVNARTIVGSTAMLLAAKEGHEDVVASLTRAGALTVPPAGPDKLAETLFKAVTLLADGQAIEAAECLLALSTDGENEHERAIKKAAAVALANYAVSFSNKYLGQLTQEMSRNGWDSGYNLGAAQESARNLKFKTITWLKMASALDPSDSQISGLIDSYFKMHVTTVADRELLKR